MQSLQNKQVIGEQIELWVKSDNLTYLEATAKWLDENSINEFNQCRKYIPQIIIDKIREECIRDNILKPSLARSSSSPSLNFLFED